MAALRITSQEDDTSQTETSYTFNIACGNCALKLEKPYVYHSERAEIDVYNQFVDDFAKQAAS